MEREAAVEEAPGVPAQYLQALPSSAVAALASPSAPHPTPAHAKDRSLRAYCLGCGARYRLPKSYAGRTKLLCALCEEHVTILDADEPYPENTVSALDEPA